MLDELLLSHLPDLRLDGIISWTPAVDKRANHLIKIKFSSRDCRHCPSLAHCVRSKKPNPRRTITIRNQPDYLALQLARQREQTSEFRSEYARRAGIEGTISRGIRTLGLRRTRYVGQDRVHLGHILMAVGLNFLRLGEWFLGIEPAKTRITPFVKLMARAPTA